MRFVALDFETSGLDCKRHAPVTLGVCVFDESGPLGGREWLIAPPTGKDGKVTREYDVAALEISGQSWVKIKRDGMPAIAVLNDLKRLLEGEADPDCLVVAFNAPFDYGFWSELLFQAGGWNQVERRFEAFCSPLVGPWQCARMLAMHTLGEPTLPKWNLDTVAAHFGFAREGEKHGALEDAILAGKVYSALTAKAVAA